MKNEEPWYAARCLYEHRDISKRNGIPCYEERVVVFRARSFKEAIRKGETEARRYGRRGSGTAYLGFIDVFHLFASALKDGTEVFSIMRSKEMPTARFIKTFYDDGSFHRGTEPPQKRRATKPANRAFQRTTTLPRSARAGARR
jgi:Domain of unknown function (DUF4288)